MKQYRCFTPPTRGFDTTIEGDSEKYGNRQNSNKKSC